MSPPLDSAASSMDGTGRAANSGDTTGFFILRKDSERRQQLISVTSQKCCVFYLYVMCMLFLYSCEYDVTCSCFFCLLMSFVMFLVVQVLGRCCL